MNDHREAELLALLDADPAAAEAAAAAWCAHLSHDGESTPGLQTALRLRATALHVIGRHRDAAVYAADAVSAAQRQKDAITEIRALNIFGCCLMYLDDVEGSFAALRGALHLAVKHNDARGVRNAVNNLGALLLGAEAYAEALPVCMRGAQLSGPAAGSLATALNNAAVCHMRLNQYKEAVSLLERAVALAVEGGFGSSQIRYEKNLVWARWKSGSLDDVDVALVIAQDLLVRARALGLRDDESHVLLLQGELLAEAGRSAAAIEALAQAADAAQAADVTRDLFIALEMLVELQSARGELAAVAMWSRRLIDAHKQQRIALDRNRVAALEVRALLDRPSSAAATSEAVGAAASAPRRRPAPIDAAGLVIDQTGIGAQSVAALYGLSPSELRVLLAMVGGEANRAIAARFGVSPHTVRHQVSSVLRKMNATSRTEAVARALRVAVAG